MGGGMNNLLPGDKIICVNDSNCLVLELMVGKVYTFISYIGTDAVWIKELHWPGGFKIERFVSVKRKRFHK